MKILFSNLGYARGIDGSLWHHISRAGRHVYVGETCQRKVIAQLQTIIRDEHPDLCCFVEIDSGSTQSSHYNQMRALSDDMYRHHDIANKYGADHWLARAPFHASKSNGFLSRAEHAFERLYFRAGRKRLIYRLSLPGDIALYFAHFSLKRPVRAAQFREMENLIRADGRASVLLADFNIFGGLEEISGFLGAADLVLVNDADQPTFTFHRRRHLLDLCLASRALRPRMAIRVLPQPFSDHAALCVEIAEAA
jgi:endonuclease/exonuclease/phosphatase family metal-dependent hydrolase